MNLQNRPIKNYPRNTRFRAPMLSMQINDILDEIYYELVELLGFENRNGDISPQGDIEDVSDSISSEGSARWTYTDDDVSARLSMFSASEISPSGIVIEDSISILDTQRQARVLLARYRRDN